MAYAKRTQEERKEKEKKKEERKEKEKNKEERKAKKFVFTQGRN